MWPKKKKKVQFLICHLHLVIYVKCCLCPQKATAEGTSLAVQGLRLCTSNARVQVLYLVGELRSQMLRKVGPKKKKDCLKKKVTSEDGRVYMGKRQSYRVMLINYQTPYRKVLREPEKEEEFNHR